MKNLWIVVACLGAIVFIVVVIYNELQARRYVVRQSLKSKQPTDHPHKPLVDSTEQADTQHLLPANLAHAMPAASIQRPPAPVRMALDDRLDAIAYIHLPPGVVIDGATALAAMPANLMAEDKPCAIEGLVYNRENEWQPVTYGMHYSGFRAGIQLANREGPINRRAMNAFGQLIQQFVTHPALTHCQVDWPDEAQAIQQGRELDTFANEHDLHLHFTIHAANGMLWSVAYLLEQAQQQGFVLSAIPGELVLSAENDRDVTMLTLKFDPQAAQQPNLQEAFVDEFQINMALSAIPASADPVMTIYTITSNMSRTMGGLVVDNRHGRRVGDDTLIELVQRLTELHQTMDERGFPAGSPLMQRLLS